MAERCPKTKPNCLKKSTKNKSILFEKNCSDTPYRPIDALTSILYNYENKDKDFGDKTNKADKEQHCYPFDTAWLAVIKDIEKRLHLLTKTDIPSMLRDPAFKEQMVKDLKKTPLNDRFNLTEIFTKIADVGRERWNCTKSPSPGCDIANAIITGLDNFIKSEGFKKLSDMLSDVTQDPQEMRKMLNEAQNALSDDTIEKTDIIKKTETLFQLIRGIMNPVEDLTNLADKDVEGYFSDLTNLMNTVKKGGKKTKKRRTKRKGWSKKTKRVAGGGRFNAKKFVFGLSPSRVGADINVVGWIIGFGLFWALFALEPVRLLGVGAYNVYEKVKSIKDRRAKAAAEAERIRREQEEAEKEAAAINAVDRSIERRIHGAKLAPYAIVDPNTKKTSPRSYHSGDFPPPLSSPSTKPPSYKTAMAPPAAASPVGRNPYLPPIEPAPEPIEESQRDDSSGLYGRYGMRNN
jgi:hypothetical protein